MNNNYRLLNISVILILGAGLNDDKIANNTFLEPREVYESFYSLKPAYIGWKTQDYTLAAIPSSMISLIDDTRLVCNNSLFVDTL